MRKNREICRKELMNYQENPDEKMSAVEIMTQELDKSGYLFYMVSDDYFPTDNEIVERYTLLKREEMVN